MPLSYFYLLYQLYLGAITSRIVNDIFIRKSMVTNHDLNSFTMKYFLYQFVSSFGFPSVILVVYPMNTN